MSLEYVGPYKDAAEDWMKRRYAMVPISVIPDSIRIAVALPALDNISRVVSQQESNRETSKQIIDAARVYMPPFTTDVIKLLEKPAETLLQAGVNFKDLDVMEILQNTAKRRFTIKDSPEASAQVSTFEQAVKDRRRDLQALLHPDKADRVVEETIDANRRTEIFTKTTEATETVLPDSDAVNFNYVRTMPAYIVETLKRGLARGLTPEQIFEQNPKMLEKIGDLLYLAQVYLPLSKFDKTFLSPQDAEKEATVMKEKDELYKRVYAFSGIFTVFAGLAAYAESKGVDDITAVHFSAFTGALLEIGGMLGGIVDARERGVFTFENTNAAFKMAGIEQGIKGIAEELGLLALAFVETNPNSRLSEDALRAASLKAYQTRSTIKEYIVVISGNDSYSSRTVPGMRGFGIENNSGSYSKDILKKENKDYKNF